MKLTLKGFQSHENSELDITGNYVTVTGPNNVGKSSLIRAALWLFYNAMRGSKFIRKGFVASVAATFEQTVERFKGGKEEERNSYKVNDKALSDIDKDIPPEAAKALGIWPVKIDKDVELMVNVVRQKDHPFLMDESGTAKAKILNALTGHNILDVALRETSAILKRGKARKTELEEQTKKLSENCTQFADIEIKQPIVNQAREVLEKVLALVERVRASRQALTSLESAQNTLQTLRDRPVGDVRLIEQLWSQYEVLANRIESVNTLNLAHKTLEGLLRPLKDINLVEGLWVKYEDLASKIEAVRALNTATASLDNEKNKLQLVTIQLDRSLAQLQMLRGSTCTECGQEISDKCLETV